MADYIDFNEKRVIGYTFPVRDEAGKVDHWQAASVDRRVYFYGKTEREAGDRLCQGHEVNKKIREMQRDFGIV